MIRTKDGHQVLLDDSPGQEAIRVTSAGGRELILTTSPARSRSPATASRSR